MITKEEFFEINNSIHSRVQGWFGSKPTKLMDKSFTRDEAEEVMEKVGHPANVEVYPVKKESKYYLYFYRYPNIEKDADKYNVDGAEEVYEEIADGFEHHLDSKLYHWFHRYSAKIPKTPDR
jgi:hypothetical protein